MNKNRTVIASLIFAVNLTFAGAAIAQATTSPTCPLISSAMKLGWDNDPAQVSRLQGFLRDHEALSVQVNGTFDQATESAVESFQRKYADTILAPWGATKPSGVVLITTLKKINEIACGQAMTLSEAELSAIRANGQAQTATTSGSETHGVLLIGPAARTTVTIQDTAPAAAAGTAAAANSGSTIVRFWSFLKGLF